MKSTVALVKNPGKYLDWRAWFRGLWSNCAVAGATAFTTLVTSNCAESVIVGTPWLPDGLQSAVRGGGQTFNAAIFQFVIHVGLAAAKYISDTKGLPPEKTNPPMPIP